MTPAAKKRIRELLDSIEHCINSVPNDALREPTEAEIISYLVDQECNIATAMLKGKGMILGLGIKDIIELRKLCHQAGLKPEEVTDWSWSYRLVRSDCLDKAKGALSEC